MNKLLGMVVRFLKFFVKKFFPKKALREIKKKYFQIKGRKNERHYGGNAVFCPCCGKFFSEFINFFIDKKNDNARYVNTYKNTVCPYCFSLPRHRIACYYLDKNKQFVFKKHILMFGAEYSIKKYFELNNCVYLTADLFDRSADINLDIQHIHFSDESLELIICNHILEHVPDYKLALKELNRVLSKNGVLEITVPTDRNFTDVYEDPNIIKKKERIKHFGQYDHLRIFGNNFKKDLNEAGFFVEIVDGDTLPSEIGAVIGPMNYDDNKVYICRKMDSTLFQEQGMAEGFPPFNRHRL